jgi:UDP-N-acetylmuramyl pentapeptide synthase
MLCADTLTLRWNESRRTTATTLRAPQRSHRLHQVEFCGSRYDVEATLSCMSASATAKLNSTHIRVASTQTEPIKERGMLTGATNGTLLIETQHVDSLMQRHRSTVQGRMSLDQSQKQ